MADVRGRCRLAAGPRLDTQSDDPRRVPESHATNGHSMPIAGPCPGDSGLNRAAQTCAGHFSHETHHRITVTTTPHAIVRVVVAAG